MTGPNGHFNDVKGDIGELGAGWTPSSLKERGEAIRASERALQELPPSFFEMIPQEKKKNKVIRIPKNTLKAFTAEQNVVE